MVGRLESSDEGRRRRAWGARKILATVLITLLAAGLVTFMVIQAVRNRAPPEHEMLVRVVTDSPRAKRPKRGGKRGGKRRGKPSKPAEKEEEAEAKRRSVLGVKEVAVAGGEGDEAKDGELRLVSIEAPSETPKSIWSWSPIAEPESGIPEVEQSFLSAATTYVFTGRLQTPQRRSIHMIDEGDEGVVRLVPSASGTSGTQVMLVRHAGMPALRFMVCLLRPGGKGLVMVTRPTATGSGVYVDAMPQTLEALESRALCVDMERIAS